MLLLWLHEPGGEGGARDHLHTVRQRGGDRTDSEQAPRVLRVRREARDRPFRCKLVARVEVLLDVPQLELVGITAHERGSRAGRRAPRTPHVSGVRCACASSLRTATSFFEALKTTFPLRGLTAAQHKGFQA
eukprot:scaffold129933_cov48-Phaeocystis_antarctica.AAC.3